MVLQSGGFQNEERSCKLPLSTGPKPTNRGTSEATPGFARLPPGKSTRAQQTEISSDFVGNVRGDPVSQLSPAKDLRRPTMVSRARSVTVAGSRAGLAAAAPAPGRVCSPAMAELERTLLRRLRDRDEQAFRELIEGHRDRVFNITYRMLGNRSEAEDVAQEVFITVFKTIDSFREESKFSTWLFRVTVNHCKNRIKYLARRHDRDREELDETQHEVNGAAAGPPAHAAPDRALAGAQLEALLQDAIAKLDDDHRVVVVLRDVEDLTIEEICEITGLPDGTVKSRLHRARLALRKKLARHV
jgi:RNA polymerase sigma-70 factor, ECF subfamily